jgi:monovalent cation:H+ antiporter-2, CPA2 family
MEHLTGLIADLALILITGAVTTILFRKIRQPLVPGYIIAGLMLVLIAITTFTTHT